MVQLWYIYIFVSGSSLLNMPWVTYVNMNMNMNIWCCFPQNFILMLDFSL